MSNKILFILITILAAALLFDPIIPIILKQILYAISLTIKSIILLFLPLIIFGLLFNTAITLAKNATKVIGTIIILVCCSNFLSTFLSHSIGQWIYSFNLSMIKPKEIQGLTALWTFKLPILIPNDVAMFSAIISGVIISKLYPEKSFYLASKIEKSIRKLLNVFTYIIPLFVLGFIIKMQNDGFVGLIIKDYAPIFALIAISQFCYILLVYLFLNNFSMAGLIYNIKNMFPAALSGFTTMSSAASMPLTMIGAAKNAKDKHIARSVIPATTNIHLVGDCFAIPILAYAILKSFGMQAPSLYEYLVFSSLFVIAKFSVAAIPGGGIIVMLPILESRLGFNAEMLSLITALYLLFDPVITSANVLGNGAFAKMFDNLFSYFQKSAVKI